MCSVGCIVVQTVESEELATLKICLMLVYRQQSEALMIAVILTITNCLPGEVAWAQCDGISCKQMFFFFSLMSQSPWENNINDLSSVTNILWVFHQKSRQCCIARRGLTSAPSPTSRLPFCGLRNERAVIMGKIPHGLCRGGGNLKQDAPGWTGRGSRYLWPVRESHRYTFTPTILQRAAFTCWSDEVTAGRTQGVSDQVKGQPFTWQQFLNLTGLTCLQILFNYQLLAISKDMP